MAASSAQLSKHAAQAMESGNAKLKEVMKNAKADLQRKEVVAALADEQIKALAVCQIESRDLGQSEFAVSHSYVGDFLTEIPRFVTPVDGATFVHHGSKCAIIYTLDLKDDRSPSWLLAWSKPEPTSTNHRSRVYVRVGPSKLFQGIDFFSGVELALDHATENARDFDPTTGALITAEITNSSAVVGSVRAVITVANTPN